ITWRAFMTGWFGTRITAWASTARRRCIEMTSVGPMGMRSSSGSLPIGVVNPVRLGSEIPVTKLFQKGLTMDNKSHPDKLHGILIAHSAFLFAIVRTLSPVRLEAFKAAYSVEANALMAHMLHSDASDALLSSLQTQI